MRIIRSAKGDMVESRSENHGPNRTSAKFPVLIECDWYRLTDVDTVDVSDRS
jgi:hypothetical protein